MTGLSARILKDSLSPFGSKPRLTTMEVVCHRFVLAEFNTHRQFSRNSASSRAIPFNKMVERVREDPAIPLSWPSEQRGMQGGEELTGQELDVAMSTWLYARDAAVSHAQGLSHALNVHKSVCNRLLEPFMWHTIIVSSTEWKNFFVQRCSPLAQPEIRLVAEAMRKALDSSIPEQMVEGQWHLPLIDREDVHECEDRGLDVRKISAARCARVSYLTHDGYRDVMQDYELFLKLSQASPPHASPLEHVATPTPLFYDMIKEGNFRGWRQLRHEFFETPIG